jgi:predicted FMN-binding regulatory protein PaiB
VYPALIMTVCEELCVTAIPFYLSRLTSEQLKSTDRFAHANTHMYNEIAVFTAVKPLVVPEHAILVNLKSVFSC